MLPMQSFDVKFKVLKGSHLCQFSQNEQQIVQLASKIITPGMQWNDWNMGNVTTCLFKDQAEKKHGYFCFLEDLTPTVGLERPITNYTSTYHQIFHYWALSNLAQSSSESRWGWKNSCFWAASMCHRGWTRQRNKNYFPSPTNSMRQASESPTKVSHLRDLTSTGNGVCAIPFVLLVVHATPLPIPNFSSSLSPFKRVTFRRGAEMVLT